MSNYGLRKNAEGYTDPTAAATLTRKECGDIWEYNGTLCLIIKDHNGFSTILQLTDLDRPENIAVDTSCGTKFVSPQRITYGLHGKMGRYMETLSAKDFERVIEAVETALAIDLPRKETVNTEKEGTQETARLMELADHMESQQKQLTELEHRYNLQRAELTAANNAAAKARNQLELLRDMYNDLLAKMVGGGE